MNHHYQISNHIWNFFIKSLVEEKDDEVVIRDISVTNEKKQLTNVMLIILNNDIKKTKVPIKKWDFGRFPYGRDYKYG